MILEWREAGNDYTARYEDNVFRLHKTLVERKLANARYNEKVQLWAYELQIKKEEHIQFKSLDQYFCIAMNYGPEREIGTNLSVKGIEWKNMNDILEETENILGNYGFTPAEEETSPLDDIDERPQTDMTLHAVSLGIIFALRTAGYLKEDISEEMVGHLGEMVATGIAYYDNMGVEGYFSDDEELNLEDDTEDALNGLYRLMANVKQAILDGEDSLPGDVINAFKLDGKDNN